MPVKPIRADTQLVHVTIYRPGTEIPIIKGIWDKKSGGQIDSEETIYHPGGMEDPVSLGGRRNMENLTLSRLCRLERDWEAIPALLNAVGKSDVVVSSHPLDFNGHAYQGANTLTYNGTLKRVTPPDVDSESSGPAMIEIEVTVEGYPS